MNQPSETSERTKQLEKILAHWLEQALITRKQHDLLFTLPDDQVSRFCSMVVKREVLLLEGNYSDQDKEILRTLDPSRAVAMLLTEEQAATLDANEKDTSR